MEQHPIPQDVTGFQFKLIGSMTVKQFGFVAAGIILAVILYYLPIKGLLAIPIKMILIPLFGISGIIISFVPIEGRPADVMATNFAKALFSPNQYVYKRQGRQFSFSKIANVAQLTAQQTATAQALHEKNQQRTADSRGARLEAFLLDSSQSQVRNKLDEKEVAFFKNISAISAPVAPQPITNAASPTQTSTPAAQATPANILPARQMPPMATAAPTTITPTSSVSVTETTSPSAHTTPPSSPEPSAKEAEALAKEETVLEQQLAAAKEEETKASPTTTSSAHQKMLDLEKKIQEIHQQKLQAEQELLHAKEQLALAKSDAPAGVATAPNAALSSAPAAVSENAQHVRVVPQGSQQNAGLPHIPDTPNVVVGIVKDPRGNVLSNILVEIKDKDNNPVRAFKTNALGHFASATPLATGSYTIELEDPKKQNRFDIIQLVADNQILLPLEIISHDAREELRKQLFN